MEQETHLKMQDISYLTLKHGENTIARVGIALSSQVFKKAAERNRARRLVSQAFQSIINQLPATLNIVALPKPGVLSVKSVDILSDLEGFLKDEKLIN